MIAVNFVLKQFIVVEQPAYAFVYALNLANTRGWKLDDVRMFEGMDDASDTYGCEEFMTFTEMTIGDEDVESDEEDKENIPEITQYQTAYDSDF